MIFPFFLSCFDNLFNSVRSPGVKKMLPASYDNVSEETKNVVQLFMAHAHGFLHGFGMSDDAALPTLEDIKKEAMKNAVKMALEDWEESQKPCSAEQFVQCFAKLIWEGLTDNGWYHYLLPHLGHPRPVPSWDFSDETDVVPSDDRPFPFDFTAPVVGGPLSTEFLEAIGKNETDIRGMIKKKEIAEEDTKLSLYSVPTFVKTETSPPGTPNVPAAPTNPLAQRVKVEPQSSDNTSILGKRKDDEPDATTRKHARGNDGQRVPPASRDTNRTDVQWSGVPLAPTAYRGMNLGLMNEIWWMDPTVKIDSDSGHRGWMFEVKIPKEKAWLLLGKDINDVFRLLRRQWYPIRLHTYELDAFLHIGLWILESQTRGHIADVVRQRLPMLLEILKRWSVQAQGSGKADSLKNFLAGY